MTIDPRVACALPPRSRRFRPKRRCPSPDAACCRRRPQGPNEPEKGRQNKGLIFRHRFDGASGWWRGRL